MSSPSFFAPSMRICVRSAPRYAATDATPGVGSTAPAASATKHASAARRRGTMLEAKQRRGVSAEDLLLLALVEVLALPDRRDRVRVFGIEVRVIARHEDAVLAQL